MQTEHVYQVARRRRRWRGRALGGHILGKSCMPVAGARKQDLGDGHPAILRYLRSTCTELSTGLCIIASVSTKAIGLSAMLLDVLATRGTPSGAGARSLVRRSRFDVQGRRIGHREHAFVGGRVPISVLNYQKLQAPDGRLFSTCNQAERRQPRRTAASTPLPAG